MYFKNLTEDSKIQIIKNTPLILARARYHLPWKSYDRLTKDVLFRSLQNLNNSNIEHSPRMVQGRKFYCF